MKDAVSIRQRPAVEDRAVPCHWEGDLLSGPNNTYIATLVERQTRYVMLAKLGGKDSQTVVTALIKQAKKLPKELYKSLTWDRGKELMAHRRFTLATKIDVYFAIRKARGGAGRTRTPSSAETVFSQGTDLLVHSQAHLNKVARSSNDHVRPCNLKPQQRDLTPVLRRPAEPAGAKRKITTRDEYFAFRPTGDLHDVPSSALAKQRLRVVTWSHWTWTRPPA